MMIRSPGFSTTLSDIAVPLRPQTRGALKILCIENSPFETGNYTQTGIRSNICGMGAVSPHLFASAAIPAKSTGAANLKFLSVLLQVGHRNFKFKAAPENNKLLELL